MGSLNWVWVVKRKIGKVGLKKRIRRNQNEKVFSDRPGQANLWCSEFEVVEMLVRWEFGCEEDL